MMEVPVGVMVMKRWAEVWVLRFGDLKALLYTTSV